jgi:SAM-dependent methyltransferase
MKYDALVASQMNLSKAQEPDPAAEVWPVLALIEAASGPIPPGARILDLGCAIGGGVTTLLSCGYDAYGVDIYEYWGKDAELYWLEGTTAPEVKARLSVGSLKPYKLPFPDNCFDYVISMQVLEHVDDRFAVFREIERVLKPGGTSVHLYPDPWGPIMEGHINVPISPFCKSHTYLKLAAMAGFRSVRQKGLGWREVYEANAAQMEFTHYAPRRRILREARAAGLAARYAGNDYVSKGGRGWTKAYKRLSRFGLGWVLFPVARLLLQPMLVLTKPDHATE